MFLSFCHSLKFCAGWNDVEYVSINNGIYLCFNCAQGIHIPNYPGSTSYIKSITNDDFNYLQLRLMINAGNQAAFEFFETYDLTQDSVQKRYSTQAAHFYREKLRK